MRSGLQDASLDSVSGVAAFCFGHTSINVAKNVILTVAVPILHLFCVYFKKMYS